MRSTPAVLLIWGVALLHSGCALWFLRVTVPAIWRVNIPFALLQVIIVANATVWATATSIERMLKWIAH